MAAGTLNFEGAGGITFTVAALMTAIIVRLLMVGYQWNDVGYCRKQLYRFNWADLIIGPQSKSLTTKLLGVVVGGLRNAS